MQTSAYGSDEDDDDEAPMLVEVALPTNENTTTARSAMTPPPLPPSESELLPPCPVTILSGFLGSGKVSLKNEAYASCRKL
jgi:hypothetical protein